MARTICKILGVVFILVGLLGYAAPNLMGMHLSGMHNIIHLISGVLALYFGFAASYTAARTFSIIFGVIYLLLGIIGFASPATVAALVNAHEAPGAMNSMTPDNVVHVILGIIFLAGAFARAPHTTHIPTEGGHTAHS
ncbi:MAG: DUF4383 domain-containing protein [Blastocatellia bacterium]